MRYWLIKTEPGCFSIDDLENAPKQTTMWDGVRNYQARNFIKNEMNIGDQVLFYHSVTGVGIVGLAEVISLPYPDPTQWDPENEHFDPGSKAEAPRWFVVDIHFLQRFSEIITLQFLRTIPELSGMELLRKGSRLSVQPVDGKDFSYIINIANKTSDA